MRFSLSQNTCATHAVIMKSAMISSSESGAPSRAPAHSFTITHEKMITKYVYLKSSTDAHDAPIFNVRVGSSAREQIALAGLLTMALADDDIFFCKVTAEAQEFLLRLMDQNPQRDIYECSAAALLKLANCANSAHVKNLSRQFRARAERTAVATHQKLKS